MKRIGLVTIGQSPRDDILPVLKRYLPPRVELVHAGLLDGVPESELDALAPGPGEYVLVTRLRDGTSVQLGRERILPRLKGILADLGDRDVEIILLLCTGEFPSFTSQALVIEPDKLIFNAVKGIIGNRALGVVIPLPEQVEETERKWADLDRKLHVVAASPYEETGNLEKAAARLAGFKPGLVVLDCMGFGPSHKEVVRRRVGCPVLLSSSFVARTLAELVS